MTTIEIWDGASVELGGILDAIPGVGELRWSIMELWAVGRDDETDIVSVEQAAASSPTGLELSGIELRALAGRLLQLVDGIVVGYRGAPPSRWDADLDSSAELVIEAVDSTYWRVFARDPDVIDALRDRYVLVEDADSEPTHMQ